MNTLNRSLILLTALSSLYGCGSSGVSESAPITAPQEDGTGGSNDPFFSTSYPALKFPFTACGGAPSTLSGEFAGDNALKLQFKLGPATGNGCYADGKVIPFNATYTCAKLAVKVLEKTGPNAYTPSDDSADGWRQVYPMPSSSTQGAAVPLLKLPGTNDCAGAVEAAQMDLSGYMYPGHGLLKVEVTTVASNFLCLRYRSCLKQFPQPSYYGNQLSSECKPYFSSNAYGQYFPFNESNYCGTDGTKAQYIYNSIAGEAQIQVDGQTFTN